MGENLRQLLDFVQGPLIRFALAILFLGLVRAAWISVSNALAAYLIIQDRREFRRRFWQRVLWHIFPTLVIHNLRGERSRAMTTYHVFITALSIVFRIGVIVIPAFMVAHVYLWERWLGMSWPSIPARISDVISVVTVVAGVGVLLGRVYSPLIRSIDPPWAFFKPLILLVLFITGLLAMHPTWSPISYHAMRILHVGTAALVFLMIPFGRMLAFLHAPIEQVLPEAAWPREETSDPSPAGYGKVPEDQATQPERAMV
jgi:hypothetical protein